MSLTDAQATAFRQRVGPGLVEWVARQDPNERGSDEVAEEIKAFTRLCHLILEGAPDFDDALRRGAERFDAEVGRPGFQLADYHWL